MLCAAAYLLVAWPCCIHPIGNILALCRSSAWFVSFVEGTHAVSVLHRQNCRRVDQAAARPVLAVKSGGPMETVVHGETGFLCPPDAPEGTGMFGIALLHQEC